jgi:hypothetical protein
MEGHEFVEAVKRYVRDESIEGNLQLFLVPPGRAPKSELVELSRWYNALDDNGKEMVRRIVRESVDAGLFGLFCVLDGVRTIEGQGPKGEFQLYYVNGDEKVLLNDFDKEFLHDLYKAE